MRNLKSIIFDMLMECEVSEVHGIMGTASVHEEYSIRYMGNLIVHYIDSKQLESIDEDPTLVGYIEMYSKVVAEYTNSDPAKEKGIFTLIKNL